jgi:hypothetical protein
MVCQGLVVPQGGGQIKKMREMICDHVMRPHFSFFRFGQIGQDFKIYFHNFPNFGEILKIPKFRKLKMISEFQIFRNLRLCCVLVWCGVVFDVVVWISLKSDFHSDFKIGLAI